MEISTNTLTSTEKQYFTGFTTAGSPTFTTTGEGLTFTGSGYLAAGNTILYDYTARGLSIKTVNPDNMKQIAIFKVEKNKQGVTTNIEHIATEWVYTPDSNTSPEVVLAMSGKLQGHDPKTLIFKTILTLSV